VNEVFEADEFEVAVRLRAQRLAQGPRHALGAIKRGVELATHASLREVLDYERETQTALFLGAEARAGISAFVDKRAPEWPRR